MPVEKRSWGKGWSVGLRIWLERDGQTILGKGRLELLEGIDRWRSISAAARQMGMSYRRAWELVQGVNAAAGEPLVEAGRGGVAGGGAYLTPLGRWVMALFSDLQGHLRRGAAAQLARLVQEPSTPELHVAAAVSLEEVLGQILVDYALRQPAVRVRVVFGASDELADHILAGAPADLLLSADAEPLERLRASQLLTPDRTRALAENSLAAIGPAADAAVARKPSDLARPAVRLALADPCCPLGRYTRAYLSGLALYDRVASHAVVVENSRAVIAAVRGGRANAGLVYASDAACAAGCQLLFQPRRLPVAVRYTGALVARGGDRACARAFLAFLRSPEAARRFRACGFLPVARRRKPSR